MVLLWWCSKQKRKRCPSQREESLTFFLSPVWTKQFRSVTEIFKFPPRFRVKFSLKEIWNTFLTLEFEVEAYPQISTSTWDGSDVCQVTRSGSLRSFVLWMVSYPCGLIEGTMKSVIALSLIASAAAFAPATKQASSVSLKAFEDEIGVLPPTGFFDPIGFCKDADADQFARWRAVELKHGRVAMLAVVGYVTQEIYRFPGDIDLSGTKFADIPNGVAALSAVPAFGWVQILFTIGCVDKKGIFGDFEVGKPDLDGPVLAKRQLQEIQ